MTMTLFRRATSTRYIFVLSGLVFVMWSLATSLLPRSSALSVLFQTDLDHGATKTGTNQHATTNASSSLQADPPNAPQPQPHPDDDARRGGSLGIPHDTHIYVISLADREDRRTQMALLRTIQNLTWTVVDATPQNASLVGRILDRVARTRGKAVGTPAGGFRWPEEIDAVSVSRAPWTLAGSDAWVDAVTTPGSDGDGGGNEHGSSGAFAATGEGLACAIDDDVVPTFANGALPDWRVLSPAKIACWHSHVSAIRRFVEGHRRGDDDDVAVLFEDDVDMEKDIAARLARVWTCLPAGWDIVFLGHCWSDESHYPPVTAFPETNLHPSHHPKCTHAYALSHAGARRLLQHLRYPPFAYSRALDQAYAWLVRSGRLRSYSVVPSLVVQRKRASSDISPGSGSAWREGLREGVFAV